MSQQSTVMSCALTAFTVKIVASGETAVKAAIAREAIYEWNAGRSWEEKKAFLPLFSEETEDTAEPPSVDLLVAFFRGSQKSSGTPPSSDPEIGHHLKSGRPVLIYLSEARTDLKETDTELPDFKSGFPADAVVDSFKDEKEFRAKFAQRIDALVRYHPHFQTQGELSTVSAPGMPTAPPIPEPPDYSKSAQNLLMSACDDPEAYLARMNDSRGLKIQVNGRQYIEPGNADSAAQWDAAFNELLRAGLIRDAGCNGQLFQISSKGFKYLETLGKFPVGYIAELGGM